MLGEAQRGGAGVVATSEPAQPMHGETGRVALLFPVRPVGGESLLSVVCRAAALNHLPTPRPALALIDAPADARYLHARPDLAPAFARLIGVAPAEAASRFYGPRTKPARGVGEELDFFGTRVPAHWLTTAKRVAPSAFARSPHHRAVWDLAILDVCPDAGERLIEVCPRCGRRLRWLLSAVGACSTCGWDLARAAGAAARKIPDDDLAGAKFVADLLAPWRGGRAMALQRLPGPLRSLRAAELVRLVLMLPDIIPVAGGTPKRRAKRDARERRPHRALAAGLEVLEGWPGALHAALDRLSGQAPDQGRFGVRRNFGQGFLSLLQSYEKDAARCAGPPGAPPSAYEVVLAEIGRYFASRPRMPIGRNAVLFARIRAAFAPEAGLRRAVSMTELREAIGWQHARIRRLLELWPEIVLHSDDRGSGAPMLLDAELAGKIVAAAETAALSVPDAAAALGVSHPVCRELLVRGLLRRLDGRVAELRRMSALETLIARGSVDEIASRLATCAQDGTGEHPLALRAAVSRVTLFGLGAADLIALMLDGTLLYHRTPPTRPRRKGRFPFVLDGASIDRFRAARRSEMPMAIKAASAALRWNQQTVLSMLRAGEMRALPGKGRHRATLIPRTEVARAKLDYVTTAQVGARLAPDPPLAFQRALARELRGRGLEPVLGDGGAAGRTGQLIWRSGDLTDDDHRELSAWARQSARAARSARGGGRKP